jgi:hypothetical protein
VFENKGFPVFEGAKSLRPCDGQQSRNNYDRAVLFLQTVRVWESIADHLELVKSAGRHEKWYKVKSLNAVKQQATKTNGGSGDIAGLILIPILDGYERPASCPGRPSQEKETRDTICRRLVEP